MAIWDDYDVGDSKIPDDKFDDWFYTNFQGKTLEELFGTNTGWHQNDGDFKLGDYLHYWQTYGTMESSPHVSNQKNLETQYYTNPETKGPGTSSPNPLDLYEINTAGNLVATSRLPTSSEKPFTKIKGYYLTPGKYDSDGDVIEHPREATLDWFKNSVDFGKTPDTDGEPPADWLPDVEPDGKVLFRNMPAREISPMFSTLGRRAMSFGRFACRIKMPSGATGNNPTDLRDTLTTFPAFWLLQDVIAKHNLNGELADDNDTDTPGNQAAGDNLPELDPLELFGYQKKTVHHTLHYYEDGWLNSEGNPGQKQVNPGNHIFGPEKNVTDWMTVGCDITPGKIFYWVDDIITMTYPTPASISNPLPRYVPRTEASESWRPQIDEDTNTVITDGIQTHADGTAKYMKWFAIWNIAHSAKFTRELARITIENNPTSVVWHTNISNKV